jgi:hypothetical protein
MKIYTKKSFVILGPGVNVVNFFFLADGGKNKLERLYVANILRQPNINGGQNKLERKYAANILRQSNICEYSQKYSVGWDQVLNLFDYPGKSFKSQTL